MLSAATIQATSATVRASTGSRTRREVRLMTTQAASRLVAMMRSRFGQCAAPAAATVSHCRNIQMIGRASDWTTSMAPRRRMSSFGRSVRRLSAACARGAKTCATR